MGFPGLVILMAMCSAFERKSTNIADIQPTWTRNGSTRVEPKLITTFAIVVPGAVVLGIDGFNKPL